MNVYTAVSPSHAPFVPWFNTLRAIDPAAHIHITRLSQACGSGEYHSHGWADVTREKLHHFIHACRACHADEIFVCADIDMQFFKPLSPIAATLLGEHDIVFQNDYLNGACVGFFICRNNARVQRLFEIALEHHDRYRCDQLSIQAALRIHSDISFALLGEEFFTYGKYGKIYECGAAFTIPQNIICHHANWTVGIENKYTLLREVRAQSLAREGRRGSMPPYRVGCDLEEYFYTRYVANKAAFDRIGVSLIPLMWTSRMLCNDPHLQKYVDACTPGVQYFAVSQHDDAIVQDLPHGTLSFAAGGNNGGIPIPLVCETIPPWVVQQQPCERTFTVSFVGSIDTHPVRRELYKLYCEHPSFKFITKDWSMRVSDAEMASYINVISSSKFALCPRGYGASSYRFYEALQLGAVPILVYDVTWFPFDDVCNYDEFCIRVHINDIHTIASRVAEISEERRAEMVSAGARALEKYFSLEGIYNRIYEILKEKAFAKLNEPQPFTTKIVVCTTDAAVERRSSLSADLTRAGCTDVTFYTDYDARTLTNSIIKSHYVSYYDNPHAVLRKLRGYPHSTVAAHKRRCNSREISLTIKLGKIYESLASQDFEYVIILEDDAILCENFGEVFAARLRDTPDDWDAIYFGECCGLVHPAGHGSHRATFPYSRGCVATLLRHRTVCDLARSWFPFNLVSDFEMTAQHHAHGHRVYWWDPPLVGQGSERGIFKSMLR